MRNQELSRKHRESVLNSVSERQSTRGKFRFSIFSALLGLLFLAASLTPSLIPRDPAMQGVLGGAVLAIGYFCGRVIEVLWLAADLPVLKGRTRTLFLALASLLVLITLLASMRYTFVWQNDLRLRLGMEPSESTHYLQIIALSGMVFVAFFTFGSIIAKLLALVSAQLARKIPPRRAAVFGFVIVGTALFFLTRDGLLDATIRFLDQTSELAQDLFGDAPPAPTDPRMAGSAASLIDWDAMGRPGRNFVSSGPDASAITRFTGRPALDPIRVYVGRANAETPQERAELALAELKRLKAFDRKIMIVVSPTGTGWMDPGSSDPLEYMHDGDVATVSVQYSFLQSPFALLFETETGLNQANATLDAVHDHWKTLPPDARPELYVHGLSLGAWSSMYATDVFRLANDPIAGAFWAGPPFPSNFWNRVQNERNAGSPWVKPEIGNGSFIRYAARGEDGTEGAAPWGDLRIMFLQYPSDPIVFFEPQSFWRKPHWMREAPGEGVSPYLVFVPIVTPIQLILDMAVATSAPPGFGHSYYAQDYIGPWVQLTAPDNWTDEDTERLKAHCDNGFQEGCSN